MFLAFLLPWQFPYPNAAYEDLSKGVTTMYNLDINIVFHIILECYPHRKVTTLKFHLLGLKGIKITHTLASGLNEVGTGIQSICPSRLVLLFHYI